MNSSLRRVESNDDGLVRIEPRSDAKSLITAEIRDCSPKLSTDDSLEIVEARLVYRPEHDVILALADRRLRDDSSSLRDNHKTDSVLPRLHYHASRLRYFVLLILKR